MILASIWFLLWAVLWLVYFILDGFDLGAAILLPFVGKNDDERAAIINTLGPVWNGNEVWLITAGGAMFAAFPRAYATMFSFFYSPLMLVLVALIIRGAAIEFRYHPLSKLWVRICDIAAMLSSLVVALGLGALFANIFVGLPIGKDGLEVAGYHFFNPYSLLGGLLFIALFVLQGALWLTLKLPIASIEPAKKSARITYVGLVSISVVFLVTTYLKTTLFVNYLVYPIASLVIAILLIVLLGTGWSILKGKWGSAFTLSSLTIAFVSIFAFGGLYPRLLPSSIDVANSLTLSNATSSQLTLSIMLGVALVFVPLVLIYQGWTYFIFRRRPEE